MENRRYDDTEAAAIFRAAAEGPAPSRPAATASAAEGFTLPQLQAIGGEVGIPADAVARAALALDVQRAGSRATLLGFPIGVSRVVELPRRLTDEEWERLVVRFREVFDAARFDACRRSSREWRNGNLHVYLEPTETAYRLRFRTVNGSSRGFVGMGLMAMGSRAPSRWRRHSAAHSVMQYQASESWPASAPCGSPPASCVSLAGHGSVVVRWKASRSRRRFVRVWRSRATKMTLRRSSGARKLRGSPLARHTTHRAKPIRSWRHLPLVRDEAGRRLAKRHQALSIRELRARGLSPAELLVPGVVAR